MSYSFQVLKASFMLSLISLMIVLAILSLFPAGWNEYQDKLTCSTHSRLVMKHIKSSLLTTPDSFKFTCHSPVSDPLGGKKDYVRMLFSIYHQYSQHTAHSKGWWSCWTPLSADWSLIPSPARRFSWLIYCYLHCWLMTVLQIPASITFTVACLFRKSAESALKNKVACRLVQRKQSIFHCQ